MPTYFGTELWWRILPPIVFDELAAVTPDNWETFRGPGTPSSSPLAQTLGTPKSEFIGTGKKKRLMPLPNGAAFSLVVSLDSSTCQEWPRDCCYGLEPVFATACNVRRLRVDAVAPNQTIELASRLCPAVCTFAMADFAYDMTDLAVDSPWDVDSRIVEEALTRWHAAGYGGVRNIFLAFYADFDDEFALSLIKSCKAIQTIRELGEKFEHGRYPRWKLSAAVWDEFVNIKSWHQFDWGLIDIPNDQPEELPRRMKAFAQEIKPNLTKLRIAGVYLKQRKLTRDAVAAVLKACPSLTYVNICYEHLLRPDDVYDGLFTTLATPCANLKSLNIRPPHSSKPGIDDIFLKGADFHSLVRMAHLTDVKLAVWKDMAPQHLLLLTHVPASVQKRKVEIAGECQHSAVTEFLEALIAQCYAEARGEVLTDTLPVTTGGCLNLVLTKVDPENECAKRALTDMPTTLNGFVSTPRRFRVEHRSHYYGQSVTSIVIHAACLSVK
ncbi:hypothetical protein BDZ88DRAFT_435561 [Geranomyces variabilis]|nr:hypothetical protein BDZ88DRAFT_435561 [Geranomyces variabilis]KAJ3142993.1 hypothetical protein HDU90_002867 [Geranomyces variabilis]